MKLYVYMIIGIALLLLVCASLVFIRKRHLRKLKHNYYLKCWKEVQAQCKTKTTWPEALNNADKLLDRALRKKGFKGKTMGERMVSAQRTISDNDAVWFAHNLSKKLRSGSDVQLKERNIKSALVGFRQALRDIGALPNEKSNDK